MNRLKELRKARSLSLDEVADAVGKTRSSINFYENEKQQPRIETWQNLANYFGVSVPYLQGYDHTYTREELIKLLIKYDNYRVGYEVAKEEGDMDGEAREFAKLNADKFSYWEGIDWFVEDKLDDWKINVPTTL